MPQEPSKPTKLYAFVDESGPEPDGRFLYLAVVLVRAEGLEFVQELRQELEDLEGRSGRAGRKWARTGAAYKAEYVDTVVDLLELLAPIYWRRFAMPQDRLDCVLMALSEAYRRRRTDAPVYVTIDGLARSMEKSVRAGLQARGVPYKDVRGGRDESCALLRLADAAVGFVRDVKRQVPYAVDLWPRVRHVFHRL